MTILQIFKQRTATLKTLNSFKLKNLFGEKKYYSSVSSNVPVNSETYQKGVKIHGYTVIDKIDMPIVSMSAVRLKHDVTGGEHVHVFRDDLNNVFSIGFQTNPPDSTGVPHILEHTTLCGSEKYQVRDPFFKMLNRSLSNFMNAMTANNYTFYPFATTNKIDFSNLQDVYLDSTLHPLLRFLDFRQEGWRFENENVNDENSNLIYKGVVYNEMKGQMSDASYYFYIRFQESIYPSLNNSGGDPKFIPNLTYQGLKDFHARNYNPSNSRSFTYGNFPLEDHLEKLNKVFSTFSANKTIESPQNPDLLPINLDSITKVTLNGPIDQMIDSNLQEKISISWIPAVGKSANDLFEIFCLKIIMSLLISGHGSPLYQALIESKLGTDYSPNTTLEILPSANIFTIGLQGVAKLNLEKVLQVIQSKINESIENGFEVNRIEGIIHQLELSRKTQSAQYGMSLLYSLMDGWFNNKDPLQVLNVDKYLDQFKQNFAQNPQFLSIILKKYFHEEAPKFIFHMTPQTDFEITEKAAEDKEMQDRVSKLTDDEKKKIYKLGLEGLEHQNKPEDLSVLPTLNVADIPRNKTYFKHQLENINNVSVQWNIAPANGLTYFHGLVPLNNLPKELIPYVPLYSLALTNLGTKTKSMAEIEEMIKLKTGGISACYEMNHSAVDLKKYSIYLGLNSCSLDQNSNSMFDLLKMLILETDFDNLEKLKTLISMNVTGAFDVIANSGHKYALGFAKSKFSEYYKLSEKTSGLDQIRLLKNIDSFDLERFKTISEKLGQISLFVKNSLQHLKTSLTVTPTSENDSRKSLEVFINSISRVSTESNLNTNSELNKWTRESSLSNTYINMPFQVSYVGSSLEGVPYTHSDGAKLQVLANLLTHKYLHGEIREKGGAYGGGATYAGVGGMFSYYSYRDPNPQNTLATISKAPEYAMNKEWTERDLEEAKLSIFQGIDAPESISSYGMVHFLQGITAEQQQKRREEILDVNISDVKDVAERYLLKAQKTNQQSTAIIGSVSSSVKDNLKNDVIDFSDIAK